MQQSVQDISRSSSDATHIRVSGGNGHARAPSSELPFSSHHHRHSKAAPASFTYSAQMALFVVFDKKAGLIRIADSAVSEVEMYDTGGSGFLSSKDSLAAAGVPTARRSRASIDFMALREGKGVWVQPSLVELPPVQTPNGLAPSRSMYILTRGKQSHIVPAPLPATIQASAPLYLITWNSHPLTVTPRVCLPSLQKSSKSTKPLPFLQLIGMGEVSLEVHEIPLATLSNRKGKEKEGVTVEATHTQSFLGEIGFLANGGHWHQPGSGLMAPQLERADSATSTSSFGSTETEDVALRMRAAAGAYCSLRKDVEDWRVIWVGGDSNEVYEDDEDEDGVLV